MKISNMDDKVIDNKQREKLSKRIEKIIAKQEKRVDKLNQKLEKSSKVLNGYFENIDTYKQFVEANKRLTAPRFANFQDHQNAVEDGRIEEGAVAKIGKDDPVQDQKDAELVEQVWKAEIYNSIMRGKKPMELPEPTKEPTKNAFIESLREQAGQSKSERENTQYQKNLQQQREQEAEEQEER